MNKERYIIYGTSRFTKFNQVFVRIGQRKLFKTQTIEPLSIFFFRRHSVFYEFKKRKGKLEPLLQILEQAKRLHRLGAQGMSREYDRVFPQFHALVELTNLEGDDKNKVKKIYRNLFEMRLEAIS